MSRLADKVRELAEATSAPTRAVSGDTAERAEFARASIAAVFGSPDRALAAVEALEAAERTLDALGEHFVRGTLQDRSGLGGTLSNMTAEAEVAVRAVRRSWEQALGIAE